MIKPDRWLLVWFVRFSVLFCFLNFCFYYVLGDRGSKLDQGSGFFGFVLFFLLNIFPSLSLKVWPSSLGFEFH